MPQLDPNPWFLILVFSWLIFLVVIPQKILSHTFTNETTAPSAEKLKSNVWNWPWH
uniref:ATP synthase complex subunit 8 n=1 Tax=Ailia coila TaxID=390394 RepID=A0A6C0W4A8_9TELE|nr:ATP synthase F0 subunit 8 [Ailia coila]QIC20054.1 ATP synthase F0 subunit 8 [Ailia coila]